MNPHIYNSLMKPHHKAWIARQLGITTSATGMDLKSEILAIEQKSKDNKYNPHFAIVQY